MSEKKKECVCKFDVALWKHGNKFKLIPVGEKGCDHGHVVEDFIIKVEQVDGEMKLKVKQV